MFWCFDCVSKPNSQDNCWWMRRFSVLPLNRTSKASSGLVISTSTQFITYIQSLESVLRILVWGGLHINHTLIYLKHSNNQDQGTQNKTFIYL